VFKVGAAEHTIIGDSIEGPVVAEMHIHGVNSKGVTGIMAV